MTMSESSSGGKKKEDAVLAATRHVRALLISAPNGLNIVELQNDYLSIIGKPFPYRELGYKTPLDLLKAMPDVVQTTWNRGELILKGIADETSKHIAKLVAKQKKSSKRRATCVINRRPAQTPDVPYYVRTKIKELLTYYPSGILGSRFCEAYFRHFHSNLDFKRLGFSLLQDLLSCLPVIVRVENIKGGGYRVYGTGNVSADTNKTAEPTSKSSVSSNNSRNTSTIKTFKNNSENDSGMKIRDLLDSKSGVCEKLKKQIAQMFFEEYFKFVALCLWINKILCKRPNGVWAARLPVEYKKSFGKDLRVREHGFANVMELADAMPDLVKIERPTKTGDWLLHSTKEHLEQELSQTVSNIIQDIPDKQSQQNALCTNKQSDRTSGVQDGVGQGTFFHKLTIPDSGYVSFYVSHCINPTNFWVILTDEWPKLEALGKDLSAFYNSSEGDKYNLPEKFISVGQVCCAWCADFEDWFRAVITGVSSMQNIEVFYVDYGNTSRLTLSELRMLRSPYLNIPGQAVYSQLAYIKPLKEDEWSPGSCHRFYHLTKNYKALFGLICGRKDEKLCVCLSDTSSEEDIHINDLLVDEGYAMFCPDSPVSPDAPVRISSKLPAHASDKSYPAEKTSDIRQPPGLPPARHGQQFFNQHIASTVTSNTSLPDFPLQLNIDYNGEPLIDRLINHDRHFQDLEHKMLRQHTSEDTRQVDMTANDDLAFIKEVCNELGDEAKGEYFLKRINLMDMCTIHVINYHKQPYVTSADISALFWDSDVLRSMLRQKKLAIPKVVLSAEEDRELIEELIKCEVRGMVDQGCPRGFVTLYPLNSLPDILCTFNHPLEELASRVDLEIRQFENEGDDYWLVTDTENESTDTESESQDEGFSTDTEQLAVEELKLVIQAMQFRRKRILQSLMTPSASCTQNTVEELVEVENKIEKLRNEVLRKEEREQTNGVYPMLRTTSNQQAELTHC